MRYNHLMNTHFSSCVLLARGYDPHRERNVTFHALPGEFDVVGLTDGTDAWVCPISSPFLAEVKKSLDSLRETGRPLAIVLHKAAQQNAALPSARRRAVPAEKPERHRVLPVLRQASQ